MAPDTRGSKPSRNPNARHARRTEDKPTGKGKFSDKKARKPDGKFDARKPDNKPGPRKSDGKFSPRKDGKPNAKSAGKPTRAPLEVPRSMPKHPKGRARHLAAWALSQVIYEQRALLQVWPLVDKESADGALVRQIVLTTLRHLGQVRALLASRLTKPLTFGNRPTEARMLCALTEIFYMESPNSLVVSSAVDAAPDPLKNMVNAVLRRAAEAEEESRATLDSAQALPSWLRERWVKTYGKAQAIGMASIAQTVPPLDLTLAAGAGGTFAPWSLRVTHTGKPHEVEAFASGQAWVQDLAASLPLSLLPNLKDLRVLDLCAAPGGKTLQLAASGAQVTALDSSAARLGLLRENLERTGLKAEIVHADALEFSDPEGFDLVVLDAPCSATGTLRRHPDLAFLRKPTTLLSHVPLQARMLDAAFKLVKPGGKLLYAVCSLESEEGEQQIADFLMRTRGAKRVRDLPPPPPGLEATRSRAGFLRTLPSMLPEAGGMDGFFAALVEKSTR